MPLMKSIFLKIVIYLQYDLSVYFGQSTMSRYLRIPQFEYIYICLSVKETVLLITLFSYSSIATRKGPLGANVTTVINLLAFCHLNPNYQHGVMGWIYLISSINILFLN